MFSFNRFFEQLQIILKQNALRQGLNLLIIALCYIFSFFWMYYSGKSQLILDYKFCGFVVAVFTLVNSITVFSALLRTDSSIQYYMTPASIGEKYLAAWFYSSILTIAAYTFLFLFSQWACLNIGNTITGQSIIYAFPDKKTFTDGFIAIMSMHSVFFLGAVVFKKSPFWKTLLTIVIINFIIGMIVAAILSFIYKSLDWMTNSHTENFSFNFSYEITPYGNLPLGVANLLDTLKIMAYSLPFIFWIAAYIRLKTREV